VSEELIDRIVDPLALTHPGSADLAYGHEAMMVNPIIASI
jgi:hypothetical protein